MKQMPGWMVLSMFIGVFFFVSSFFFVEDYGWWVLVVGASPNLAMGIYGTLKGYDFGEDGG